MDGNDGKGTIRAERRHMTLIVKKDPLVRLVVVMTTAAKKKKNERLGLKWDTNITS